MARLTIVTLAYFVLVSFAADEVPFVMPAQEEEKEGEAPAAAEPEAEPKADQEQAVPTVSPLALPPAEEEVTPAATPPPTPVPTEVEEQVVVPPAATPFPTPAPAPETAEEEEEEEEEEAAATAEMFTEVTTTEPATATLVVDTPDAVLTTTEPPTATLVVDTPDEVLTTVAPPTAEPTSAPTAAPTSAPVAGVKTELVVEGMNYDKLVSDPELAIAMKDAVRKAYAAWLLSANIVAIEEILVTLSPGSVKAEIEARFVDDNTAESVAAAVTYTGLTAQVKDAIDSSPLNQAVVGGIISVSSSTPEVLGVASTESVTCFPGESTVTVQGYGTKSMASLRLGDKILVEGQGAYEPVIGFLHNEAAASHSSAFGEFFRSVSA